MDEVKALRGIIKSLQEDKERLIEALKWYAEGTPFRDDIGNPKELAVGALKAVGVSFHEDMYGVEGER